MKTAAGIEADREQGTALVFGKRIKIERHLEDGPERLRVAIPFQLKSLDDETRTIQFIGSTNAVDRYGDVVEQNWDLGNFMKNPVIPWGHDYSSPPVAKALEVGYKDGSLTFTGQFADAETYPFADQIYKMYKGGYLRAFSVGFIPLEYDGNYQDGYTITKSELLEVSCVTVPANPEALVLAFKEGVLSVSERKAMIAQATKLIKSLTSDSDGEQNEDMETAKALEQLKDVLEKNVEIMAVVRDLLVAAKDEPEPDKPEDKPADEPETDPDKPADDPAGGAEDDKDKDKPEPPADVVEGITPDDIKAAVRGGVKKELDYRLGKI